MAGGSWLKVHHWEVWQSYRSDREQPPWIKVHRRVMRHPEWVSLTDAERGQLLMIWLLAAENNGFIPNDANIVKKLCCMDETPNLEALIEKDFLEPDAGMTPPRRQVDAKTTAQIRLDKIRLDKKTSKRKTPAGGTKASNNGRNAEGGLQALRSVWEHCELHRSNRASQGWSGKGIQKRIGTLLKVNCIEELQDSIRRYAARIQQDERWQDYAVQFSTFFGPKKEVYLEFLEGEPVESGERKPDPELERLNAMSPEEQAKYQEALFNAQYDEPDPKE